MAIEIKPPAKIPENSFLTVFLAGTIEMGRSEDWQAKIVNELNKVRVTILNPRRNFWNTAWKAEMSDPNFQEQVDWELDGLEKADLIVLYLAPGTHSPISLLELGLFARSGKMVVCCPQGFEKKGNVDIVCKRFGIKQVDTFDGLVKWIKDLIPE